MAADSITLRGAAEAEDLKPGRTSAVLLKLDEGTLQELKRASREKDGLRFTTGSVPKLRLGGRSIDLTISPEAFRTELYASTAARPRDFSFMGVASHRAELKLAYRAAKGDTSGSDAALAALQSSLASYEQEKQANRTNITNSLLPAPNSRFEAARKEKSMRRNNAFGSQPASPSLNAMGTPRLGAGPTSAPTNEDDVKMQAMKKAVIHLLAIGPTTSEDVEKITHIPRGDLNQILRKYGEQIDGKWQPRDRTYRDLDVWKFKYPSQGDRDAAIENAVKAYDRMRLGKDDKLWQMLLTEKERDKGKVLSRLHLGQVNRGLTPSYQPSPGPHLDAAPDSRAASTANTPKLGASTPRPSSKGGDVMKRLLSKDPKKARAAEDAKEKKRKEREAAASDREGARPAKKQAAQKANANVKSAEFVHSSDEESSDERPVTSQPKPRPEAAKPKSTPRPVAASPSSPESSDAPLKSKVARKAPAKTQPSSAAAKHTASPAAKPTNPPPAGRATPQTTSNLSAPSSQQKSQRSPQKQDSKPPVPSPLGAARPRVASDVSDRNAVGIQRVKQGGGETPKGLGIVTNGASKHKDKPSVADTTMSEKTKKDLAASKQQRTSTNGTGGPKATAMNGVGHDSGGTLKRKAERPLAEEANGTPPTKHRKQDSGSSQSLQSQPRSESSTMGPKPTKPTKTTPENPTTSNSTTTAKPTSDPIHTNGVDAEGTGYLEETITYSQGVALAEKFRDVYYPAYTALYDQYEAAKEKGEEFGKEEWGRLLAMHRRLEQIKREIEIASTREFDE